MPIIHILAIRQPRGSLDAIDHRESLPAAIHRCQELYRLHPEWFLYTRAPNGRAQLVLRLHYEPTAPSTPSPDPSNRDPAPPDS